MESCVLNPGGSQLHSVQEVEDDMDFALEEEMVPDLTDSATAEAGHQTQDGGHLHPESGDDVQVRRLLGALLHCLYWSVDANWVTNNHAFHL